jgi:hypothetical protein
MIIYLRNHSVNHHLNMIMQINELEITRKLKRFGMGGSDLANLLRQHGWTPLGFGYEAGVAEHPNRSYVLKIFPQNSQYVHFVRMVQQHPDNPHFPRFSRYVRQIPGTSFAYVRMEKLTRMREYDLIQFPSLLCVLDKMWHDHGVTPPVWIRMNVTWDPDAHMGLTNCRDVQISPQEQDAIQLLSDKVRELGWRRLDLHAANFMTRGNQWVITDPFI